jgi:outer membrane immunogenic protein
MTKYLIAALAGCSAVALVATGALADGGPSRGGSVKDAPVAAAPFSWSGFYVGGNVGGAWSDLSHNVTYPNGNTENYKFDPSSFAGGVQAGYQIQMGTIVLGLEGGLTGFDLADSKVASTDVIANQTRRSDVDWLFTLTPRIGFAMDKWMVYLKGGYANAEVWRGSTATSTGALLTGTNRREDGWTIGTGFEYAVAPWVSLGVDYSYVNIDPKVRVANSSPQFVGAGTFGTSINSDIDLHLVTARINFKLGGGR